MWCKRSGWDGCRELAQVAARESILHKEEQTGVGSQAGLVEGDAQILASRSLKKQKLTVSLPVRRFSVGFFTLH